MTMTVGNAADAGILVSESWRQVISCHFDLIFTGVSVWIVPMPPSKKGPMS